MLPWLLALASWLSSVSMCVRMYLGSRAHQPYQFSRAANAFPRRPWKMVSSPSPQSPHHRPPQLPPALRDSPDLQDNHRSIHHSIHHSTIHTACVSTQPTHQPNKPHTHHNLKPGTMSRLSSIPDFPASWSPPKKAEPSPAQPLPLEIGPRNGCMDLESLPPPSHPASWPVDSD